MSRVTRKEWYQRVNDCWPENVPALTADEAVRAGRKLYRFATGDTWQPDPVITSGNRYSYIHGGYMYVNPERGWKALVHGLSHSCIEGAHGSAHARLEMRMIKHVVKLGWLGGALKDKPKPTKPAPDKRALKYARTLAAIARWTAKEKRAANALKKLRRSLRAQERMKLVHTPGQLFTVRTVH